MIRIHATAVAIDGWAVLLVGPSGAGKSDLALRLIDRGAVLVADDQVELTSAAGRLIASAPATIAGRIEVRGVGILDTPATIAPVALVIDLARPPERLPEPAHRDLAGIAVPEIALAPFESSAPIKVERALKAARAPLQHPFA
ncbi:MAG: aldolase [Alphaproteobacteria bacterium]|nr:aldolase [Alphaproteobacteria bacterium]